MNAEAGVPVGTSPENLLACSECGLEFSKPVSPQTALEFFTTVEDASFHCGSCADEFEGRGGA